MGQSAIQIRRLPLEFPAEIDPMIIEGCPEQSYLSVGFSPKVLATYLPWYTPHRIAMPEEARLLAQHYFERSLPNRN